MNTAQLQIRCFSQLKIIDIFLFLDKNICYGYSLEVTHIIRTLKEALYANYSIIKEALLYSNYSIIKEALLYPNYSILKEAVLYPTIAL